MKKKLEEEKRKKELAQQEAKEAKIRQEANERAYKQKIELLTKLCNKKNDGVNLVEIIKKIGLGGVGFGILGAMISPVCPVAGPVLIVAGIGSGISWAAGVGIGEAIIEESKTNNL